MKTTFITVAAGSTLLLVTLHPTTAQPLWPFTAAIPLHQRTSRPLADADGNLNWDAAQTHMSRLFAKYQHGLANYQLLYGEPLLGAPKLPKRELEALIAGFSSQTTYATQDKKGADEDDVAEEDLATISEALDVAENLKAILPPVPRFGTPKCDIEILAEIQSSSKSSNSLKTTSSAKAAAATSSSVRSGKLGLKNHQQGRLWYGTVTIGTPPKPFFIDFDTGSADFWIPSSSCSSCSSTHRTYTPSSSSTSVATSDTFQIAYGDGSTTSGKVYVDTVVVAGIKVQSQTFGAADRLVSGFEDQPMDGIMGMAFQSLSSIGAPPVFASMIAQKKVSSGEFSFKFGPNLSSSHLFLGGSDTSSYTGTFEWHKVVSKSYWVIFGSAKVGSTVVVKGFNAIIDTGTTVIVAPLSEARTFWAGVKGAKAYGGGYYTYPCDSAPTVSLNFGGKDWRISPANLNLGAFESQCVGAIVGQELGLQAWIVGDSFLKGVYTTFDMDKSQVGFAALA